MALHNALIVADILIADALMIRPNQRANRILIRLRYQICGILVLPGAFRTDHFVLCEHIHPLATEDCVVICCRQGIGNVFLIPDPITAVLRLTVNGISDNTVNGRILLLHQRHIIATRAIPCGHGRCHTVRAGIAGVNAVVLINQRLVSMLLSTERPAHVFGTIHDAAALIV